MALVLLIKSDLRSALRACGFDEGRVCVNNRFPRRGFTCLTVDEPGCFKGTLAGVTCAESFSLASDSSSTASNMDASTVVSVTGEPKCSANFMNTMFVNV